MPPKKKGEAEEKMVLIGRMGTNLKCGIVGLPNVGKSTFFNVLTKSSAAAAENFPFCTIDPNEARVPVPDSRSVKSSNICLQLFFVNITDYFPGLTGWWNTTSPPARSPPS